MHENWRQSDDSNLLVRDLRYLRHSFRMFRMPTFPWISWISLQVVGRLREGPGAIGTSEHSAAWPQLRQLHWQSLDKENVARDSCSVSIKDISSDICINLNRWANRWGEEAKKFASSNELPQNHRTSALSHLRLSCKSSLRPMCRPAKPAWCTDVAGTAP